MSPPLSSVHALLSIIDAVAVTNLMNSELLIVIAVM